MNKPGAVEYMLFRLKKSCSFVHSLELPWHFFVKTHGLMKNQG